MGITKYYEDICDRYPLLSVEDEAKLIDIYFSNDTSEIEKRKAREHLICSNLRFVFQRAKRYSNGNVEQFEELIAAGNEGLLVGLEKFDPTSGNRYLTYAGWWVMQRQLKEMSKWRIVSLPAQKQQLATKVKKFIDNRDTHPTIEELQKEFPKASLNDLKELSLTQYLTFYLDSFTQEPEIDPIGELEIDIYHGTLLEMVKTLPKRDSDLLIRIYGLEGEAERPQAIARDLGIRQKDLQEELDWAHVKLKRIIQPKLPAVLPEVL